MHRDRSTVERGRGLGQASLHERIAAAFEASRARPGLTAFLISVVGAFLVTFIAGNKPFYFDSGSYWNLSELFTRRGHFDFFDFEDPLRGYSWPLLLWTLRNVGEVITSNMSLAVRVLNASIFAAIGSVLVPGLAMIAWPEVRWNLARRLILTSAILVYWTGYLSFPLSDFPALAAALLALIAVSHAKSPVWLLVGGFSAALAVNIRPAYIALPVLLVCLLAWSWVERRQSEPLSIRRRAACVGALILGLAVVTVPQSISQHRHFGDYDPIPGSDELTRLQYSIGLKLQRYETYLGSDHLGSEPRMEYLEERTAEIVAALPNEGIESTGEYLSLIAHHPITMADVLLRHTVNGLDQRYTTPFVETLESERSEPVAIGHLLLRIGGFLVVFLALIRVIWPAGRRSLGAAQWRYPVALLIIAATSLPSAMETRFMLPFDMVGAMLVLAPGWRKALSELRVSPRRYLAIGLCVIGAVAYTLVVWTIVTSATGSLRIS